MRGEVSRGTTYAAPVVAVLLVGFLGCNAIVGIHDPIDGTPGTSSGAMSSGATSSGAMSSGATTSGGTKGDARFEGTWRTTNAQQALANCSDARFNAFLEDQVITLMIKREDDGELALTNVEDTSCPIRYTVAGDTATAIAGYSCTFPFVGGRTASYTYQTPTTTFTVNANGTSAQARFAASVDIEPDGVSCTFLDQSTYIKQ